MRAAETKEVEEEEETMVGKEVKTESVKITRTGRSRESRTKRIERGEKKNDGGGKRGKKGGLFRHESQIFGRYGVRSQTKSRDVEFCDDNILLHPEYFAHRPRRPL